MYFALQKFIHYMAKSKIVQICCETIVADTVVTWVDNLLIKTHMTNSVLPLLPSFLSLSSLLLSHLSLCFSFFLSLKLYMLYAYNTMSSGISIYPWNHHHSLYHKHVNHLPKFSPAFLMYNNNNNNYYYYVVIRAVKIRSTLTANFQVYSTAWLTVGTMLHNRSLAFIYPA